VDDHDTAPTGRRNVPLEPMYPDGLQARPLATATVDKVGDAVVVEVVGELDMHTAPHLRSLLIEQINNRPRVVVVRLAGVTFLSSSGTAALLDGHDSASREGTRLHLAALSTQVRRTLAMTNLLSWFTTYDDVPAALAGGGDGTNG
jgi:anti-anti-sigma factor